MPCRPAPAIPGKTPPAVPQAPPRAALSGRPPQAVGPAALRPAVGASGLGDRLSAPPPDAPTARPPRSLISCARPHSLTGAGLNPGRAQNAVFGDADAAHFLPLLSDFTGRLHRRPFRARPRRPSHAQSTPQPPFWRPPSPTRPGGAALEPSLTFRFFTGPVRVACWRAGMRGQPRRYIVACAPRGR